jgi:hypothetical protein
MARAGYCTNCQGNVYLNEATGGCVNGHGPECISGVYEVGPAQQPSAPAPAPVPASAAPAPQYAPPAAPQYVAPSAGAAYGQQYAPPPAAPAPKPPKKKRTGLIVAIVIIVLLLLCGCGIGGVLLFNSSSTSSSSSTATPAKPDPAKAKVTAAWKFYKAMGTGDTATLMTVMPAETVAGAGADFWPALVAGNHSVFQTEVWTGNAMTVAYTATDGTKGTIALKPGTGDVVLFTQQFEGKPANAGQIGLIEEADGWKVLELKTASSDIKFDVKSLKALETP